MKKLLALFLALMIIAMCIPIGAYAYGENSILQQSSETVDGGRSSGGGGSGGGNVNSIELSVLNKKLFEVTLNGNMQQNDRILVALYDSEGKTEEVHIFNYGDNTSGEFKNSGSYAKAFWWTGTSNLVPVCKPAVYNCNAVTINSDSIDFDNCSDNTIYYYPDGSNSTESINLDSVISLEYNKEIIDTEYCYCDVYDIFDELGLTDWDKNEKDIELTFTKIDEDENYDAITAIKYEYDKVDSVDEEIGRLELWSGSVRFDFDDEDIQYVLVDDKGNALTLSDFEEGDVVAYFTDNDNMLRYFEYIKIIKLSNNTVTGTVSEISTDGKTIWIDDAEYTLCPNMFDEIQIGDSGTFYIGMTGKIVDLIKSKNRPDYAYILEAGLSSFAFDDFWQLKLLTENEGVVIYNLTDKANDYFEKTYKNLLEISGTLMRFTDGEFGNPYRLITYKTDSEGEIYTFEQADGTLFEISEDSVYNASTKRIDRRVLEDDTVIYNISKAEADDAFTADISSLVNNGNYQGYIFNDGIENVAMIITEDNGVLPDETGFAIVTGISKNITVSGITITVEYVQDEEEGTVIFNDDSEIIKNTERVNPDRLQVGDVFMFTANSEGVVNRYAVLGQINADGLLDVYEDTLYAFSEDNEFYLGYISNTMKSRWAKGEFITVMYGKDDDVELAVADSVNKYTYDDSDIDRIEIVTDDFMGSENTDYYDAGEGTATMVFVRIVDDDVIDIYSFDKRVKAEDAEGLYINCNLK